MEAICWIYMWMNQTFFNAASFNAASYIYLFFFLYYTSFLLVNLNYCSCRRDPPSSFSSCAVFWRGAKLLAGWVAPYCPIKAQADTLNSGWTGLGSFNLVPIQVLLVLPLNANSGSFLTRISNSYSFSCWAVFWRGAKLTFPAWLEFTNTISLAEILDRIGVFYCFLLKTISCSLPFSVFWRGASLSPPTSTTLGLFSSASFLAFCIKGIIPLLIVCWCSDQSSSRSQFHARQHWNLSSWDSWRRLNWLPSWW